MLSEGDMRALFVGLILCKNGVLSLKLREIIKIRKHEKHRVMGQKRHKQ